MRRKLLNRRSKAWKTISSCEHCKNRVEEAVNDIKGVAGRVDLKKGELTVSYAEDIADEIIKAKIERTGYTVTRLINQ